MGQFSKKVDEWRSNPSWFGFIKVMSDNEEKVKRHDLAALLSTDWAQIFSSTKDNWDLECVRNGCTQFLFFFKKSELGRNDDINLRETVRAAVVEELKKLPGRQDVEPDDLRCFVFHLNFVFRIFDAIKSIPDDAFPWVESVKRGVSKQTECPPFHFPLIKWASDGDEIENEDRRFHELESLPMVWVGDLITRVSGDQFMIEFPFEGILVYDIKQECFLE